MLNKFEISILNDINIETFLDIDSDGDLSDNLSIMSDYLTESEFDNNSEDDEDRMIVIVFLQIIRQYLIVFIMVKIDGSGLNV